VAAVFLNIFLRRVFLTGAPAFFVGRPRRSKGQGGVKGWARDEGSPLSGGELEVRKDRELRKH